MNRNSTSSDNVDELAEKMLDLESRLTFQQRAFDQLNEVVLEQQAKLEQQERDLTELRALVTELNERAVGEDLPHEKPPHY